MEQVLSRVERTLNHPVAMRIINYLFERGAITAGRRVYISEIERDLGVDRSHIYRLIVGDKTHRSYLRGFVHYPDKGLREGFYLLPCGILAAIGASAEEIAKTLAHRRKNSINNFRWIVQLYHRLNFYNLPPKVKEILKRDNLNYEIAISRLKRVLKSKVAIKVLKALLQLGATSWKSATTITEISQAAELNKGTVYRLTTRVYPRAKKYRTKFRPPVLHGIVHYSQPNTREGKYYIYPKWVSFVRWLVSATEEEIQQLISSCEGLKEIAALYLPHEELSFMQIDNETSVSSSISTQFPTKLTIPYPFDSSNNNNNNKNLPASSVRRAATETRDPNQIIDIETITEVDPLPPARTSTLAQTTAREESITITKTSEADSTNGSNVELAETSSEVGGSLASFFGVVDSLSAVDRSTYAASGGFQPLPSACSPTTAAPPPAQPHSQLSGFNISIENCQQGGGSGLAGRGRRRLHYRYVRSDDGEVICKLPYRAKPTREELAAVWREWFVPNVRARVLSFSKLYEEGRCARCLGRVGQEKLKHFHVSWQRRLWRVAKRYGLDSAALQLVAFNKTYVCSDCFSMLLVIASWVARELRRSLKKHVGYDVFEPVCMRCGSSCIDCTLRKVHWARYWNEEIALKKVLAFLADFKVYLSKFEPPRSGKEAVAQLRKLEALFRKQYDPDYWSWAEWHDYPLEEVVDGEWNRNYEYTPPPERIDLSEPDDIGEEEEWEN